MFKPKKAIRYLAAGLTLSGCNGDQSDECLEVDENGKDLIDRACE